jgi:CHASE2 domain-containing sensor protein
MANLLLHIAAATPRVIVVDKYLYDQKPKCASDKELGDALTEITQNLMIPVVYGRVASDELVVSPNKDKAVYLEPSVSFQCDGLKEGILNIDRDTRKVPLQWQIFSSKEAAQNGDSLQPFDTLPLVAARAFDSRLAANESEVSRYTAQHVHPYTSFIRKEDFQVVPVGLILNPEERQIDESDPCRLPKPDPTRLALRGKVVLIGELDNSDLHPSVLGDMPGLYMQANYIEALLDNRIYRPMPALDYVVGFLFLAALELIFIVFHGRWFLMAALIVQLLAATIFLLYLFMVHLGWYVDPALVGVIALAIRLFHTLFDPAEHAAHARKHR